MSARFNPRPLAPDFFQPIIGDGLSPSEVGVGLTDFGLFPEKIPPFFSSEGLYQLCYSSLKTILTESDGQELKDKVRNCAHDFIRYEALRDSNVPRNLGVPHPEANSLLAMALERHWSRIRPIVESSQPRPSRIYPRRIGGEKIIDFSYDWDDEDSEDLRIFQINFKGPEQWHCEETEIEWRADSDWKITADIASCFPSIYTHSLPWALHGWDETKDNHCPVTFFGNLLDCCAQANRDKQTNGLLIGPHASNFLSEIILSQIDEMLAVEKFTTYLRNIDDYTFYAKTRAEGEKFLRILTLSLRKFELSLNEKKTRFDQLPAASEEDWLSRLKRFRFPPAKSAKKEEGSRYRTFSDIRPLLDLALDLAHECGKSTPLSYALKMVPTDLNERGKRLFIKEASGLGLKFPYLASFLVRDIFPKFTYDDHAADKIHFASLLWQIGVERVYPDAVAHSLFLALQQGSVLKGSDGSDFITDTDILQTLELSDCICNILLWEYGKKFNRPKLVRRVEACSRTLRSAGHRKQDQFWLLIYWTWTEQELRNANQTFLADLKASGFSFKAERS